MAKNRRLSHGKHINIPVPAGTKSGDAVKVGQIAGVAQTDRDAAKGTATVWLDGSYDLPVTGPVAQVGGRIYHTTADGVLTATSGAGTTLFGFALSTKAGAAGDVGLVEIVPAGYVQA